MYVNSAFWKWNLEEEFCLTNHLPPSLLRPWIWDFEYEYNPDFDLGMGDWISDGDNNDSLTLFHEIACEQELQNCYWTLQAARSSWVT